MCQEACFLSRTARERGMVGLIKPALRPDSAMMETLASESLSDPKPLPRCRWRAATAGQVPTLGKSLWFGFWRPVDNLVRDCSVLVGAMPTTELSLSQFLNLPSGVNDAGVPGHPGKTALRRCIYWKSGSVDRPQGWALGEVLV